MSSHFITLTYKDDFLPPFGVQKRDCQLFLKRLRHEVPQMRYFLVSEYGDTFRRPHYHALLFFPFEEVSVAELVKALDKSWTYGFTQVGDVTMSSIQYVSKYALKDKTEVFGQNPTFCLMSRRPGIGAGLFTDSRFLATHNDKNVNFALNTNGTVNRLPRYFRERLYSKPKLIEEYAKEEQQRNEQFSKRVERKSKASPGHFRDRSFRLALQSRKSKS